MARSRTKATITTTGSTSKTAAATATPAPSLLRLDAATDSGALGDNVTNAAKVGIQGYATAGSIVTITYVSSTGATGTLKTKANASGFYSVSAPSAEGVYTLTASAAKNGSTSAATAPLVVTIDRTVAAPVIDAPATSVSNAATVQLTGTAEKNSTITVYVDGSTVAAATITANAYGAWSVSLAGLADGLRQFKAKAVDVAGNVSALSSAVSLTLDHVAPKAPQITPFTAATIDTQPTVNGTAEANANVTLYVDGGATPVGAIQADGAGRWSIRSGATLSLADHVFTAKATDAAGNASGLSAGAALKISAATPSPPAAPAPTPPATPTPAPTIQAPAALTNDNTPTLSGTAAVGSTVTLFLDGTTKVLGAATASGTGAWSFTPLASITEGGHSIVASASSTSGGTSGLSNTVSFTIDSVAPGGPVITAFKSAFLNTATPTVSGTTEANALVSLYVDGLAAAVGTTTANAAGAWSIAAGSGLSDGLHTFTAIATDSAGNASVLSSGAQVTIDTKAPAQPSLAAFPSSPTNDATPLFQGTAEANASVSVIMDGGANPIALIKANAAGVWSFDTVFVPDGAHSFKVFATDAAGNVSVASATQSLTVDTTPPAARVSGLTVAGDNVISTAEGSAATLHLTGNLSQGLAAGDTLSVTIQGVTSVVPLANVSGTSFFLDVAKPSAGWAAGTVSAHVEDAAHNSSATATQSFSLAAAAPPASSGYLLGINIAGGEFGQIGGGPSGYNYIYPSHSEIDYYGAKGLDVIRVPFLWERVQKSMYGGLDTTEMALLDDVVNYATSKGLKVVMDVHNYGYGFGNLVGSNATPDAAFADFWGKFGGHYAQNTSVMFGLMNEPNAQSATTWLASANAAIDSIRKAGATNEILVPGSYWDGAWSWTTTDNAAVVGTGVKDPLKNFAFEVHQYLDIDGSGTHANVVSDTVGVERLTAITQWAQSTGNKLFLGEFGVASDSTSLTALDKMLTYMGQHTDVWQGGTYWAGGAWWGDYMYSAEPANGVDKPQLTILQQHANQVI